MCCWLLLKVESLIIKAAHIYFKVEIPHIILRYKHKSSKIYTFNDNLHRYILSFIFYKALTIAVPNKY